ncbi:hypothetical protein GO001_02680 [Streptomyces sp. NRRL B-1677]|uniref:Uncharacterized protein n=1 Tax=Streptomyces klenkii TaxID=1420899 RepID=A0A3B0BCM4_9ACTN|nr:MULTISPECIES: hypothetical protein [Streptomyces]MBF6044129.1 hypothetical protein [Streptomyces sp. NRRL B-1677]RKN70432.1 hypothetical protein D7231_21470 [Streptomyces klenkii]
MDQNTAAPAARPRTTLTRKAVLSVAVAAAVGGAIFAPNAIASSSSAPETKVEASCGGCPLDVI